MQPVSRPPIAIFLQQHVDEAVALRAMRSALLRSPHVKLQHLSQADDRLAAHLDGVAIAGSAGRALCEAALESPSPDVIFVAATAAIGSKHWDRLESLFAVGEALDDSRGLLSAFGWLEPEDLRGVAASLLRSSNPVRRFAGIAACAMHRVDPGLVSARRLEDPDSLVRARAWRTAGELGKHELASRAAAIGDEHPACRFWAAWSAVLLGNRGPALELIAAAATVPGPFEPRALQLAIQAMDVATARELLNSIAPDPAKLRRLIRGCGLAGDPVYVPWLLDSIANPRVARLAGEAFSFVTGVDLMALHLDCTAPEGFASGPNDDPADSNVDLDEDDDLPWPDQRRVRAWWEANSQRFQAGTRYFMGAPVTRENCLRVLKEGYQRQRIAAALYLSLLNPGTPLFEWRAPAWRQQQLRAQMSR